MGRIIIILALLLSGCSTINYVVNPPPDIADVYYTEEDVLDVIDELSAGEPKGKIAFDGENYIMSEETYKKAVRDGVIKKIQEEKIREFVKDYKPTTFMGELKKDAGTGLLLLILITAGMLAL